MDSTLISQGLDLMLYGMGTVFTFLTLLVGHHPDVDSCQ